MEGEKRGREARRWADINEMAIISLLLLDGQEELELWRQFLLAVESI